MVALCVSLGALAPLCCLLRDRRWLSCLQLQFGDDTVSTKDVVESLGWNTVDAFCQHDAQELVMMLFKKLEEQMKVRWLC